MVNFAFIHIKSFTLSHISRMQILGGEAPVIWGGGGGEASPVPPPPPPPLDETLITMNVSHE